MHPGNRDLLVPEFPPAQLGGMRFLSCAMAFLVLLSRAGAQAPAPPVFALSSGDVLHCELFIYKSKPGSPSATTQFLRINYAPAKSAGFSQIAALNLQKKINVTVDGKIIGETEITKPQVGAGVDLTMASPNDAFALAKTLVNPPPKPAASLVPAANSVVLSLMPADVFKVVVMLFKDHTRLQVAFDKPKQAEFAQIASANLMKKAEVILNGRPVAELTLTKPTLGHSLTVDMPSPDDAFSMATALIAPPSAP
jgi:hypothetical protein